MSECDQTRCYCPDEEPEAAGKGCFCPKGEDCYCPPSQEEVDMAVKYFYEPYHLPAGSITHGRRIAAALRLSMGREERLREDVDDLKARLAEHEGPTK